LRESQQRPHQPPRRLRDVHDTLDEPGLRRDLGLREPPAEPDFGAPYLDVPLYAHCGGPGGDAVDDELQLREQVPESFREVRENGARDEGGVPFEGPLELVLAPADGRVAQQQVLVEAVGSEVGGCEEEVAGVEGAVEAEDGGFGSHGTGGG